MAKHKSKSKHKLNPNPKRKQEEQERRQWRDWSSLPADIMAEIGNRLPLPHHIRTRLVCTSWGSAFAMPHAIPAPWLLLPVDTSRELTELTFMSVPNKTTFTCPLPDELRGTHCVGSQDGWLAMCDLSLFNPITNTRVSLPTFRNHPAVETVYVVDENGCVSVLGFYNPTIESTCRIRPLQEYRDYCFVQKLVFSSRGGEFVVVALHDPGFVVYAREGESKWSPIREVCVLRRHPFVEEEHWDFVQYQIEDIVYNARDGRFYAVNSSAQVLCFDFSGANSPRVSLVSKSLDHQDRMSAYNTQLSYMQILTAHKYLAFSEDCSQMFMVLRLDDRKCKDDNRFYTGRIVVMEMKSCLAWEVVNDLGDRSFFIGTNCFFSLSTKELKMNCVYSAETLSDKGLPADVGVYDMTGHKFEQMFADNLELNWHNPPPIWFQPSFL